MPNLNLPDWMTRLKERLSAYLIRLSGRMELDVRYFLKGGFWLSLPFITNNVLGLLRTVFFARFLDQAVYGQFGYVNSVVGILNILSLPGINTALVETVARGHPGALVDAAQARAKWGGLAALAVIAVSAYYLLQGEQGLAIGLTIAGAFIPLTSAVQVIQSYYNGRKRFDMVSLLQVGALVLNTGTLLLVLWLKEGLVWLIVANSGSQLLFYGLFYLRAATHASEAPSDPEMVAYGRSLTWANSITTISLYADNVLLGIFSGFSNLAVFSVASFLPKSVKGLTKLIMPLTMPKIAENPNKPIYTQRTRKHLFHLLLANLGFVALAILAMPFVVVFLYSDRYTASVGYAQLLMLSLAVNGPSSFFTACLQARRQTKVLYRSSLIYAFLRIGALLILAPTLGVLGVVIAYIICRWGAAAYQWQAVRKL